MCYYFCHVAIQYYFITLCCIACEQFRKLVCKYLATLLCVRCACLSKTDVDVDAIELDSDAAVLNEGSDDRPKLPLVSSSPEGEAGQIVAGMERVLVNIRDLL